VSIPPDAPVPDALDQATPAVDDVDEEVDEEPSVDVALEASEADVLDQQREVPLDDDWDR
jgi:hypothetical protein